LRSEWTRSSGQDRYEPTTVAPAGAGCSTHRSPSSAGTRRTQEARPRDSRYPEAVRRARRWCRHRGDTSRTRSRAAWLPRGPHKRPRPTERSPRPRRVAFGTGSRWSCSRDLPSMPPSAAFALGGQPTTPASRPRSTLAVCPPSPTHRRARSMRRSLGALRTEIWPRGRRRRRRRQQAGRRCRRSVHLGANGRRWRRPSAVRSWPPQTG